MPINNMDCSRTAAAGGILRSPPGPASNVDLLTRRPHQLHHRRRLPYDCDNHDAFNNNVTAATGVNTTITCTTTQLVDELEQLRTDNFQLRLRVYNAERRVDRLSAAVAHNRGRKRCNSGGGSDSDSSSNGSTDTGSSDNAAAVANTQTAAAATATAEAAVRTIHDLLTVNRRLLALLAATVSAKAVAVTADDKRRWRRLRNHINKYAGDHQDDELQEDKEEEEEEEKENRQNDESDTSTTDSEAYSTTTRVIDVSMGTGRPLVQPRSPSPPPPPAEPAADNDDGGGGPGSELARLRGRCRRLERSLQQLVNTELWARNRQIGKLEQQRYVTQVQQTDAGQLDRSPTPAAAPMMTTMTTAVAASPSATTKGILVKRSPEAEAAASTETVPQSMTTPPPVLPDYSEVNFFFSCDEEEDDDDDDDQGQEDSETNTLSSSEEDCTDDRTGVKDGEPVGCRLPLATSTPAAALARPRKRHCRRHHQRHRLSSSTESTVATGDYGGDATATTSTATVSRRRRRPRPRRYSSRCGRCGVGGGGGTVAVADAQVQCESVVQAVDQDDDHDHDQLTALRRELDARRRENCRLYEMLLRLQQESGREMIDCDGGGGGGDDDDDDTITVDTNSDRAGSPEPYKRAARAVRGRIADLLPPLLSTRSCGYSLAADGPHPEGDGNECRRNCCEQQQQQLRLLTRLRQRIVAYERQELHQLQSSVDAENAAVRHMDRAALVNVALPRAVDRLRRALLPLLQEKPEERQQSAVAPGDDDNFKPTATNYR